MQKKIKVGIDALPAVPGMSGAVGAIRNMIKYVPKVDNSVELIIFVNSAQYNYYKRFLPLDASNKIILFVIRFPSSPLPLRLWAQNFIVPSLCHKFDIDVHFSMNPEPIIKISGVKEVFKVVDLQYFDVPQEFGVWKTTYRKWMGRRKAKRAELMLANSLYTKAKIMEYLRVGPDRIRVVHEALDHEFFNTDRLDFKELDVFRKKYSITYPFIIYVSSFRPYKNHVQLLQAFSKLKEKGLPYHLILIGNDIKGYRRKIENKSIEAGLTHYIHFFDYIHHWDLRLFYAAADLAVYPSELETFGIPPLEAMACGVPVIVSDRTAVPEISGGGSLIVDPHDISLMTESMHQVLSNEKLRKELQEKGKTWCRQFTEERNIFETIRFMRDLVN